MQEFSFLLFVLEDKKEHFRINAFVNLNRILRMQATLKFFSSF